MLAQTSIIEPQKQGESTKVSLLIDLESCCYDLIASEVHIQEYFEKLAQKLNVKPYGYCNVVRYNNGCSAFQLLDSFSLSGYFDFQKQSAHIHLFCQKDINSQGLAQFSQNFFESQKSHIMKKNRH